MKTKMKTIIGLAAKIDQSRVHLKEGFTGIMRKINAALAGQAITAIDKKIEFPIESWENEDNLLQKVTLNLNIGASGIGISLFIGEQDEEGSWVWNRLDDEPEFATMKLVIAKMPEIFAFYIAELEKINEIETEAVSAMESIIASEFFGGGSA